MAQISIPMSNKVGQSMFWSSMWDDKINFSRSLKEDIFIKDFMHLIFNDSVSTKIFKTVKFEKIPLWKVQKKYRLPLRTLSLNKKDFYKYLFSINKLNFFRTKVWVLKYQKWVIIYYFIYLPKFNSLRVKLKKKINHNSEYLTNNELFSLYRIITFNTKYSYKFYKKNAFNKNNF